MLSVTAVAGALIGVILLVWLLAFEVFVVPIVVLAYVVSRQKITAVVLARASAGLAASIVGYIAVAVLLGFFLSASFWAFSQNSGVVRKVAPSFSAIAAVTDVRPLTSRRHVRRSFRKKRAEDLPRSFEELNAASAM